MIPAEISAVVKIAQQYIEDHHANFTENLNQQNPAKTISWLLSAFEKIGDDYIHPEKLIEEYPHLAHMVIRLGSAYNILRIYNQLLEEQKKVSSAN